MRLSSVVLLLSLQVFSINAVGQDAPSSTVGWSNTKPTEGPFVEAGGKYMVPYTAKIPGTDVEFSMIPIPGGTFAMGSPESEQGRAADEGPQRQIEIEPLWIGKTEVTWSEYKVFMGLYPIFKRAVALGLQPITPENKADAVTVPTPIYLPEHTYEWGGKPNQPAVTMTQYAAKQYTKWISGMTGLQYRLPSEAEWEYAARAGTTTSYSFGDDVATLSKYAAFENNSPDGYAVVAAFMPNQFGLFDMHGNVWEWVIDGHTDSYPSSTGVLNWKDAIIWPKEVSNRVVRGGGFLDPPEKLRSASRMPSDDEGHWKDSDADIPMSPWWYTDDPSREVGMRLVRSATTLEVELISKFWEIDCESIKKDVETRLTEGRGAQGLPVPSLAEKFRPK